MSKTDELLHYQKQLDRAVAEISSAKEMGPKRSEAVLVAARQLIDQALNTCRRVRAENG